MSVHPREATEAPGLRLVVGSWSYAIYHHLLLLIHQVDV